MMMDIVATLIRLAMLIDAVLMWLTILYIGSSGDPEAATKSTEPFVWFVLLLILERSLGYMMDRGQK